MGSESSASGGAIEPRVAVVIATYNRPQHLSTCLEHLDRQTLSPTKIIVVDSSPGSDSAEVVRTHSSALYIRNPLGRGHTATSRQMGVALAGDTEIVAFLDDDAFADPEWLSELVVPYRDPSTGGVGGRASNDVPGEEFVGLDDIGRFRADGTMSGNFAALPDADVVDVDHMLGANSSFRMSALAEIGGIEDYYPGTCFREESEPALRLRLSGYRIVYAPRAHVRHVAGTYARGRRFDLRYLYYGQRNHFVLLGRLFGPRDRRFRAYIATARRTVRGHLAYAARSLTRGQLLGAESALSGVGRGVLNAGATCLGMVVGLWLVRSGRVPRATIAPRTAEPSGTVNNGHRP